MKKKFYLFTLLFFLIDLISKQIIINVIDLYNSVKIIPNFFYLTYVQNKGAAFSILENKQILILLFTAIALFFINKFLNNENIKKFEMIIYSMITGGILGNLFDRLVFGYVIDFFDFRFGKYQYPIFNIADCFIVVGIILLTGYTLMEERKNGSKSRCK